MLHSRRRERASQATQLGESAATGAGYARSVAGAVAIVVILLIFPLLAAMGGVVVAALLGLTLHKDGEARHEGSELIDLNV